MSFEITQKVMFRHCDPAGIVFFPRIFEMINDCVERFFHDVLAWPFEDLHRDTGIPTAQINTRFAAPSRHGDQLLLRISVRSVGRSSMTYGLTAHCGNELRFETKATLVHIDANGRAGPWPQHIVQKLQDLEEP
jgi:4-hydroxybenzoyl-CoA thioesterase